MIVTLCGSTRFEAEFISAQCELSLRGINFFSLAVFPKDRQDSISWADGQWSKTIADLLYYDRIIHSDAIVVLGDGYIGQSTAKEIVWAWIQEKGVLRHKINHSWDDTVTNLRIKKRDKLLRLEAGEVLGENL